MPTDPKLPKEGEFHVDASELEPFAVDLAKREMQGMRPERPTSPAALAEVVANQATHGGPAGVSQATHDQLLAARARVALCDKFRVGAGVNLVLQRS